MMFKKRIFSFIMLLVICCMIGSCTSKEKALYKAVTEGDTQKVKALIQEGADINLQNKSGKTPLMEVIYFSFNPAHREIMELLLDHGADVNAQTKQYGTTALFIAVKCNYYEAVQLLLEHDANVDATLKSCYEGRTVLMIAANSHSPNPVVSPEIVNLLLDYEADVYAKDAGGKTALMYAMKSGRKDIEKILREHGAE